MIAATAMQAAFSREEIKLEDIVFERKAAGGGMYKKIIISVGRAHRVAPNHIVSAIAERANIPGKEIGKIEIYDERSIVGVPADRAEQIVRALKGLKINGQNAPVRLSQDKAMADRRSGRRNDRAPVRRPPFAFKPAQEETASPAAAPAEEAPHRGKIRLSENAKARLLDASDLSRFEIRKPREHGLKSAKDVRAGRSDHRGEPRRKNDRDDRRRGKNNDRGSIHRGKKRQG